MIVWGGAGATYFGTGGRYDPSSNSWQPTATAGAPQARTGHAATRAGDSFIVWGGYDGNYLGSGGRYCACASSVYYLDADGDGRGDPAFGAGACGPAPGYVQDGSDCDDADAGVWGTPSEVIGLTFTNPSTLSWAPPTVAGSSVVLYDLLRSETSTGFTSALCTVTGAAGTTASDPEVPSLRHAFFYLARAVSGCPGASGSLGTRSDGTPRAGKACP
jgi:hypothetical protein